jgi:phosphate transport system substrate-binding protein
MSIAMAFRSGTTGGIATLALGLISIGPLLAGPKPAATVISVNGSSTLLPFTQVAIQAFAAKAKAQGVQFTARATGTSAGLREFCTGGSSLAAASRPINSSELKSCENRGVRFLELPVAYDAITVVVANTNSWARQISTAELRRLWNRDAQGRILRWKQVNPSWPDKPISLCGPGSDSGTFDTFNKAINGSEDNGRSDITASEDDTVLVSCVARDPLAMGYFGYDYYQANRNRLRALAVTGNRGPVLPTPQTVQQSRYVPLSRPLFFYVNEQALRSQPSLRGFIHTTLQNGSRLARQAGVIPLQESTYRLVTTKLYRNVLGSAFAGTLPLGLTVGQTLDRSFDALKKQKYR